MYVLFRVLYTYPMNTNNARMELFQISRPDDSRVKFDDLYLRFAQNMPEVLEYVKKITYPKYLPWEKARFLDTPTGFNAEEAWTIGRTFRTANAKPTPIRTKEGGFFGVVRLDHTDQYLNKFDMMLGGHFMAQKPILTVSEQNKFLARGILEEAIASSQLEGANVTRKAAREMIAINRPAANVSEWMILNNYHAMQRITDTYKDVPLSTELLLELHKILCQNTMADADMARLRQDKDDITVGNDQYNTFIPPDHEFVKRNLEDMIDYANDDSEENFVHPIIKAIHLHFWVGYLHPFVDGNGRIARAVFYWYLLRKNYWLATYIPISTVIKRGPKQYSDAYIYSEQDNNDLTYFVEYNLRRIMSSVDDFINYVEEQRAENKRIDKTLSSKAMLNDRQKQIIHYLQSNQSNYVTMTTHSTLNNISINTARKDIGDLGKLSLIFPIRHGKYIRYFIKPL
jgi:Fic family protein